MNKILFLTLIALGLAQSSRAAAVGNLLWAPADANWNIGTTNWYSTNLLANTTFTDRDSVMFDNGGSAQPTVTLVGLLSPSNVLVDASIDYTFAGSTTAKLTNVFSLTKSGSGTLILDSDLLVTNSTVIAEGKVQLGIGLNSASRGNLDTAPIQIQSLGTLAFNRTNTVNFSNNITGSGNLSMPATATGTWNLYGSNTMTEYSILHNGNMPVIFRPPASLGSPTNVQVSADYGVNVRIQMGGQIHFPAACPIAATLAYGTNNVRLSLMGIAGSNSVSGAISLAGGTYADAGSRPQVNLYAQNAGSELTVYSSVAESDPLGNPYVGDFFLRGNGLAGRMYGTINLPNAQLQKVEAVTWTLYSTGNRATITYLGVNGGRLNLGVANALPEAQLTVSSGSTLDLGGFDQRVGPLWGAGLITNSSTTSDALLTLTNGGVYSGAIKDNPTSKIALKLLNPGAPVTQQLVGDCSYRGATTLDIATAIALGNSGLPNSTPIEMGTGSSIDLTNKSDHTFTLGAAQTLKGDGNVHIANGNFINQGTISLKVSKSIGVITADKLSVGSSLTYGGTLHLDSSGDALASTDTIKLFDAASYAGAFASIVPAKPGTGLAWDTSTLTTDGTLRIVSSIPTTGTNITCTVVSGGTQLQIAWPSDYTGWTLQGQTNAVNVGITTTWFDVPDSATTNRVFLPIDPANGSVFYRLYYLH